MAQSRLGAKGEPASAPRPATSARGTSCSSAGSTTRSVVAGQKRTLKLGPQEYNSAKAAGRGRGAAEEDGHHRARRAVRRAPSSTSPATPTTCDNTMTRAVRPDRQTAAGADVQGPVRHRGGLRLPVRRGVARRRRRGPRSTARSTASRSAATAPTAAPALDGTTAGAVGRRVVPLDAYAGQNDPAAVPLPHRRRRVAAGRLLRRRHHGHRGRQHVLFTDGAESAADGGRSTASPIVGTSVDQPATTTTTSPGTGPTSRTTST